MLRCLSSVLIFLVVAQLAHVARADAPSPGCGKQAITGYTAGLTLRVAKKERSYARFVPDDVVAAQPIALVVVFHHYGGTSRDAFGYGLQEQSRRLGGRAVWLFPQGLPYGGPIGWDEGAHGDDVAFFDALLEAAARDYCIDRSRVFVTGFSWGADMSNALGCYRGDKIRAVASTSGAKPSRFSRCTAQRPAFRMTYGGHDAYTPALFRSLIVHYRAFNRCGAAPDPADADHCVAYSGCAQPVIACRYPDLGHWFPPDGQANVWRFFAGFH